MSDRKAAAIVWDLLSTLLQLGGFFLALAGFWMIFFEASSGLTLSLDYVGPRFLIAGIIALVGGALMDAVESRREERSYLLPSPWEQSRAEVVSRPTAHKISNCPSCGYENDEGGFFCLACNSPLWPAGKPTSPPPTRTEVMRKSERVLMIRRIRRVVLFAILAIVISAPLTTNLGAGYVMVSSSTLKIGFYLYAPNSLANGTLFITWALKSGGIDMPLETYPALAIVLNDVNRTTTDCLLAPILDQLGSPTWAKSPCFAVPDVNGMQLNGSTLIARVTVVTGLYLYTERITRSASIMCDSRCAMPGRYFSLP